MSNWPGAGAAITLVYEARQGVNKERMISRRRVGVNLHIVTMLGLSWPHLPLENYILSTSCRCARCAGLRSTDSRIARPPLRGREDKNGASTGTTRKWVNEERMLGSGPTKVNTQMSQDMLVGVRL